VLFNREVGMRVHVRSSLLALLVGAIVIVSAPAAQAAFGVEKFFAANCGAAFEKCGEGAEGGGVVEAELEGFRTAGGYTPFGVTDFVLNHHEQTVPFPANVPDESVKNLRTDVAPGVVTNPEAVPKCSMKDFEATTLEPAKGFHSESKCPASTVIGENIVETAIEVAPGIFKDFELSGKVYNLEQPTGLASDFGVALNLAPLGVEAIFKQPVFSHTFIEGSVEWASDYHDYFTIKGIAPGLVESRLVFKGNENGAKEPTSFIRNASACVEPGPDTTTGISGESYGGATASRSYKALAGTLECSLEGFNPSFALTPETTQSDQPDGLATTLSVTHPAKPGEQDTSDLKNATIVLPEGVTMNPAAGKGLEACTPEQIGIGTRNAVTCPSRSRIGSVTLEVPTLPAGSLQGSIFLGKPAGKSIEAPPYTIYLDAESARYGVKVRLKGSVTPDPATGQLTTTFTENPPAPFNSITLNFNGGGAAPLANPLVCGTAGAKTEFTPFSGNSAVLGTTPFTTEGCTSSPPGFAPTQSTAAEPAQGGGSNTFTINYQRPDGQQYLTKVKTILPPGLVGNIPVVTQCPEPQAAAGTCTAASQIGTVTVAAGAGSEPFDFQGKVYLTGPYEGAPFGLTFVVPSIAGPFNLGNVIARAKIQVDPSTAQVIATDEKVPTIVGGIPIRLKSLTVTVNRQGFERNPTNCSVLTTESVLTGSLGGVATLKTPFQAEGCSALAFKPAFKATTSGKFSKANGASIETTITMPSGEANVKSVKVQLPKQLPSRLTTLQKACLQATFEANPASCPAGSIVGTARANTPTLPSQLQGTAYLVSHAGLAFPDLDLVLDANGVRVILVGNTDIKKGITTTTFASTPDVPVTSVTVNLPLGPHSALAAFGDLCTAPLIMPTTIVGQNGKQFKQNTRIATSGCGVRIVGHKVIGNTVYLTVKTFAAGRISGSGRNVSRVSRSLKHATDRATLKIPLSGAGRSRRRPFKVKLRVGFVPSKRGPHSSASVTVTFH
jgi:hypothetical protein